MARALSRSELLPRVISYAVLRTMPSVGMSSVGAVANFAVSGSILIAGLRLEKSVARLRVAMVLVTSRTGACWPLHSPTTIDAPYLPSERMRARPLLEKLLPITFWSNGRAQIGRAHV